VFRGSSSKTSERSVWPLVFALTYRAPRRELQGLHRTRQLSIVFASFGLVKVSTGLMWSIVFASAPQMLQLGLSASSCLRMRLYALEL
jgi:hypothetical protein